ncbi:MAG: peptidoglycan bridge formation glycyltransferase FemA/FemB family protein [Syntrophomonas sp.]
MASWQLISDQTSAEIWDYNLLKMPDYNIYQTYAWGRHRSNFSWTPLRFMACDDENNVTAMFQVMLRRYPGNTVLLWGPGGPLGNIESWDDSLRQALIQAARSRRVYCRISPLRAYKSEDAFTLTTGSWTRCSRPLNSGLSLCMQLSDEDQYLKGMTKNWRYNLNRSKRQEQLVSLWENPDIEEIRKVYDSMEELKGLEVQHTADDLLSMFQVCHDNMIAYRCIGSNGDILGFKAGIVFGSKALDLLAANAAEGRKTSASYGLSAALVTHYIKLGVTHYDLNGVDPVSNKGVFKFKKETGAQLLEYLGEWDWSTSNWLKRAFNWAIMKRSGGI